MASLVKGLGQDGSGLHAELTVLDPVRPPGVG